MSKLKMKGLFKNKSRLHRSTTDLAEWTKNDDKLMRAVEKQDVKKVSTLLTKKSLIPTKLGHQGSSVFHVACAVGNEQIVEVLLKETISVNDLTIQGNSALVLASAKGHAATVFKLLEASAEVDLRDCNEMTALHHACAGLHLHCVEVLVEGNANPHITEKGGKTPLFYAVHRGGIDICRCLIEKGADVNSKDLFSATPLMIAAKEGHKNVCEFLIRRGSDPESTDRDGHTALDYALSSGHVHLHEVFANAPAQFLASRNSITPSDSGSHQSSDIGSKKQEHTSTIHDSVHQHLEVLPSSIHLASDDEASQADIQSIHSMDDTLMAKSYHSPRLSPVTSKTEKALTELKIDYDQLNNDYSTLSIENLRLRDKVESLQMKLTDKQNQEIATLPPHVQNEIQKLKTALEEEKQKNKIEGDSQMEMDLASEQSSAVSKQAETDSGAKTETDSGASSTASDWVDSADKNSERVQSLQNQLLSITEENEKLKSSVVENQKLKDQVTQLQEECARNVLNGSVDMEELLLKNQEKEKEAENLKKQIETLQAKVNEQSDTQRLDQLIANSQTFEEEVDFDEEGFVQGRDMTKEEFLGAQNQQLKTQCGLLTKELEKLRSQFYAILEAGDQLQADYDQQAADKDALHYQLEAAVKEKSEVVNENEFLLSDNNALHEDLKKLVHELEKIQDNYQKSQSENEELKRSVTVASKVGEVSRLLEERDLLQHKCEELEQSSKTMQTDHSFLLEEVQSLTESCAHLTAERDQLAGEVEEMANMCQQMDSLQQDYNQLEQEFGELLRDKESIEAELLEKSNTYQNNESLPLPNGTDPTVHEQDRQSNDAINTKNSSEPSCNNQSSNSVKREKSTDGDTSSNSVQPDRVIATTKNSSEEDADVDEERRRKNDEEIIRLKKKVSHLTNELYAFERKHEETVSTYRTHLLSAVQGHMDPDVKDALYHIIELRSMEQFC